MDGEVARDFLACKDRDDLKTLLCKLKEKSLNAKMKYVLGNIVISKKFLRTRKIMVMHSNERGECVYVPL